MIDDRERAMSYLSTSYDQALRENDLLRCERDCMREALEEIRDMPASEYEQGRAGFIASAILRAVNSDD